MTTTRLQHALLALCGVPTISVAAPLAATAAACHSTQLALTAGWALTWAAIPLLAAAAVELARPLED